MHLEWSAKVLHALEAELSDHGHQVVQGVHVVEGLGGTRVVTVCSGVRREEMAAPVEDAIHTIVEKALPDRRRIVRIVWAEPI